MKAAEFNQLTADRMKSVACKMEFKPSKSHFYAHRPPDILLFYKRTHRFSFYGFYLVLTHDFFANTHDEKGRFKLPSYLEKFPVSISFDELVWQYQHYDSIFDFDCDMSFATNGVGTPHEFGYKYGNFLEDDEKAKAYVEYCLERLPTLGMKFFEEFSPLFTFKVMTKHADRNITGNWDMMPALARHLEEQNISVSKKACGATPLTVAASLKSLSNYFAGKNDDDAKVLERLASQIETL
jgi:hypothetical protein